MPLLLNLHGYGSNYIQQEFYGDFRPIADTENFIICHPNGTIDASGSRFWNAGFGSTVDDVAFLSALIDTLSSKYLINNQKVFSTGMSNGGYMSYTLACELPNKIKAIASVTGSMSILQYANCSNLNPIPVMQIHGTADPVVNYNGNATTKAIDEVISFWVNHNNCAATFVETVIPNTNTTDNSTATRYDYSSSCQDSASVVLYKIENGGHTWPGAQFLLPGAVTNLDFNASEEIWKFFCPKQKVLSVNSTKNNVKTNIFPNPSKNLINIVLAENNQLIKVQFFNIQGQLLLQSNQLKINITTLNQGVYILKILTENGISSQRMLKQ